MHILPTNELDSKENIVDDFSFTLCFEIKHIYKSKSIYTSNKYKYQFLTCVHVFTLSFFTFNKMFVQIDHSSVSPLIDLATFLSKTSTFLLVLLFNLTFLPIKRKNPTILLFTKSNDLSHSNDRINIIR